MEENTMWSTQGLCMFFLLYNNDLPKIISDLSKLVLFADDTSILILDKDPANLKIKIDKLFKIINGL
jgi:hypothetical protein